MKRVLIVLFVLFTMVSGSFAQETPVDIFIDPKGDFGPDNRAPALLPSVTYEDNNVFIYAPYIIESMEVVIYDATGEAVYTYTSAMVAGKNTIVLR